MLHINLWRLYTEGPKGPPRPAGVIEFKQNINYLREPNHGKPLGRRKSQTGSASGMIGMLFEI